MANQIIFFHGGGSEQDYEVDEKLVASLKSELGPDFLIHYPFLPDNGTPDLGRRKQIEKEISESKDGVILVGHSFGASMLLACLSETNIKKEIGGIFLIATPFWHGEEDWVVPFKLKPDFARRLNEKTPLFFYHCMDDQEVPSTQMKTYQQNLPWASFREIKAGGHQFNDDLTVVANDIKLL
ncbi:alpha/beta hydrolase [Dyadobacter psychrotolerans]|uniref:Alpha/beta hydrolase n=1 Tax=Dyadobacter psychrotolerans TaxID=2541721 RepID=A0A4R5DMB1_9BACT|nr:alpha/beta hydrolase [Dyadobacter psychrotolerans]TDE15269.1 alpha/beta hydrolase [Dyadobacter psychrotolerans]